MSDSIVTTGGADTWVNSAKSTANYGDTSAVHVKSGERRGLVRPPLPNVLGRTVTSATLYGHAAAALVAQEFSLAPATEHWTQGRATWTNQPAVDTAAYVYTTVAALDAGSLVAFDVTDHLQAVADGTADYNGWRLGTNSTTAGQRFLSTQSGEPAWELHVTLASDAEEPANLRPDGGGAVATAEPILAWDFDDQKTYRVQVDTPVLGVDPDEVAPDYDSGWVTHADPQHDLAAAVYTPPAGTAPTFWRVQVADTDDNTSDWSPWAEFTVAALPTLVIDAPTGAVGDPAVTVLAHLSSGTLAQWEVWATGPDRSDVRWRSGVSEGPIDVQIPLRNSDKRRIFVEGDGTRGWIRVRAQDDVDRATAVGQQTYLEEWVEVTFADTAAIAPTNLSVSQPLDGDPRLVWQWSITDIPESFLIQVDGKTIDTVGADDMPPVAGVYTWTDGGQVSPMRPHTLGVRASSDAGRSAAATVTMWSHEVKGLWLIPDAEVDGEQIEPVWLAGTAISGFSRGDRTATYTPVKGAPIDITYDLEGLAGSFEGTVDSRQDVWAALDRIEAVRKSRVRTARLVYASTSLAVRLRDIHATPSDAILPNNLEHVVRFGFVEVGD